jgi:antitoxin ParD1/3/4
MPKNTSLELRLLKEQEAKLSALHAVVVEGENSGPSTAFDFDRFIARKRKAESSAT